MKNTFQDIIKGKTVIVGIGNPLRADDGFGPALIGELKGKIDAVCLDAGSAPENYTGKVVRENPDTILLADALHLEEEPGNWAILDKDQILKSGFSTHDVSPHMFIEYLEQNTKAKIFMLGVQPRSVNFGQEMSPEVKTTLKKLIKIIREQ